MENAFDEKTLLEIVPAMVCVAGTDGFFKYLNPEWEKVLGYSLAELLSRPLFDFIHPDDHAPTKQEIDRQLKGNMTLNFQNRYRCRNGAYKVLEWTANPAEGQYLYAVARDITEKKKTDEILLQSQKMSSRTEHIAHIGSWEWDVATDTVIWSEELFRIFQIDPDGTAPSWAEHPKLYHPDDFEKLSQAVEAALNNGKPYEIELRAFRKDGETRICQAKGFPETGKNGHVVRLFGFLQDITDSRQMENELRKSKEYIETLNNALSDTIFTVKLPEREIEYVNASIETLFGYPPEDCIGQTTMMLYADKDEYLLFGKKLQRAIDEDRNILHTEQSLKKKNGDLFPAEISTTFLKQKDDPLKVISIVRDITERKHAEKALRQAQKMEAISTLAGGIAHEFNNLLGIIIGNTELALDDIPEQNPAADCIQDVRTASLRAKDAVRKLLSLAQKPPVSRKPIRIHTLIDESLKLLRKTIPETIEIRSNLACKTEMILADPTEIAQVLINLCTNSAQAMADGKGVLEVTLETESIDFRSAVPFKDLVPGEFVKLTVSDDGIGISPDILDRIFEPYFTTKDVDEGLGMGLAVVHGIVKRHEGAITAESEIEKGTTVRVLFPLICQKTDLG